MGRAGPQKPNNINKVVLHLFFLVRPFSTHALPCSLPDAGSITTMGMEFYKPALGSPGLGDWEKRCCWIGTLACIGWQL